MKRAAGLLLAVLLSHPGPVGASAAEATAPSAHDAQAGSRTSSDPIPCPIAVASRPLSSALLAPAAAADAAPVPAAAPARAPAPAGIPAAAGPGDDYRQHLRSTALGWPRLDAWCVQLAAPLSGDPRQRACLEAAATALAEWSRLLPIRRVDDPAAAQVVLECRRPPLEQGREGRSRASRGRALLQLHEVERDGIRRLEPWVRVLIDPGQRLQATTATALHELGHAFGLWGHSDEADDAMAVQAGPRPVLQLSARDRATLRWLYAQPSRFGKPLPELPPR